MKAASSRWKRIAAFVAAGLLLLMLVLFAVAWWWIPSSDELARRAETEASQRLGVDVTVGEVSWSLLPAPHISVTDIRTAQKQPIVIGYVAAWPRLSALIAGRLQVERLEVNDAVASRDSMRAFRGRESSLRQQGDAGATPLEHLVFRNVTYISWSGIPVAYDGEIDFDPAWRPRRAELRRPGAVQAVSVVLSREGSEDRWQADVVAGGGTAKGELTLEERADGHLKLRGTIESQRIEVASAVDAFHRRSPISGFASGRTVLSGEGDTPGELSRSLRTHSELSVEQGVVLRFDLDKAISSFGKERDGQTRLDKLTGSIDTENTETGMRVRYSDVHATAGKYTGRGEAVVFQRQVDAKGTVDVVDGLVGLPFTLKGPTSKPDFSVPKGVIAGAAVGTALLPGIGTVIGARIGGMFSGNGKDTKKNDSKSTPTSAKAPKAPAKVSPSGAPGTRD